MMEQGSEGSKKTRGLLWLAVFAVAMGFLEAIVVVYLRMLLYPGGFEFPLGAIPLSVLVPEIVREACTLVMLVAVAALSARHFNRRLGAFLFVFGVWDVFYYLALKVFLDWPPSFMTWDVLFLIPVTWLGPVIAPLCVAVTMAGFGAWLVQNGAQVRISQASWLLMFLGAFDIFISFVRDYVWLIVGGGFLTRLPTLLNDPEFLAVASAYIPRGFSWMLFGSGMALVLVGIWHVVVKDVRDART